MRTKESSTIQLVRSLSFTSNVRRETVPELDEKQYEALLNDEVVSIGAVTAEYLLGQKYAIAAPAKTMEGE